MLQSKIMLQKISQLTERYMEYKKEIYKNKFLKMSIKSLNCFQDIEQCIIEKKVFKQIDLPTNHFNIIPFQDHLLNVGDDKFKICYEIEHDYRWNKSKIIYINIYTGQLFILKKNDYSQYEIVYSIKINQYQSISKFLNKIDEVFMLPSFNNVENTKKEIIYFLKNTLLKNKVYYIKQYLKKEEFINNTTNANVSFYNNELIEVKVPSTAIIEYDAGRFFIRNTKNKYLLSIDFLPKSSTNSFIENFNKKYTTKKDKALRKFNQLEDIKRTSINSLIIQLENLI